MSTLIVYGPERVIHRVFNKENKLVQEKAPMENCWSSHWDLQTEANLVLMKD